MMISPPFSSLMCGRQPICLWVATATEQALLSWSASVIGNTSHVRWQVVTAFDETCAPVCACRSVHMLLAVVAREGLVLHQFCIRTAFPNEKLEEEVFVRDPAPYYVPPPGVRSRVPCLCRVLFGLD
jgi:hypothetical protein